MMRNFYHGLILRAGNLINPKSPALGVPPRQLRAFMAWCLRGGWRIVWFGVLISVLAGITEVVSMRLLGSVVDAVAATPSNDFLGEHGWLVLACVLVLLVARPLLFGGLALTQSVMIGPNIGMQTMARMFRWTLGQSVTFFDNDFAGRLAQKKMQASTSLTEIVIETVNAVTFGLATVLGTAVLVGAVNLWMVLALALWFAVYVLFLRVMLPIIRTRSAARAEAKAQVTGQVVDTISNIKTVKLFAGDRHEDSKALGAMEDLRHTALRFGEAQTLFRLGLMFIAGILPVVLVAMAIALRGSGRVAG